MPRLVLALVLLLAAAVAAQEIPVPQGFVTDRAGVIDAPTRAKIEALAQELQQKTGAEIAVLTVDTTAPLDDFSYAMRVAEAWKVGKKGEDTGVLVVVAVGDRKVRVVTGYGVEGVLPDGLVGNIQDREMVPEFRAGRTGEGIWRGVAQMAKRIADERGVTLTGVPAPRAPAAAPQQIPLWVILLVFLLVMIVMGQLNRRGIRGGGGPVFIPGGFGGRGGGDFGGFGGGGGGFGGFGGGGFGGGGAGRSW
ncbi:MAG TPA: TPM domain-containing protein [Candidatus Dormibacteraeota bacterium]|nr:TPM domain-containing protein [Candidatus Dormibacteraeota bacterium]